MTKERLSTTQLMMLLTVFRLTLTLVYYPSMSNKSLGQNIWIQELLWPLFAIPYVLLISRLWERFPKINLFQVADVVLGRLLGRIVALLYLFFLLLTLSLDLRLVADFFAVAFLPRTPIIVVLMLTALLAAWGAKAGAEVIGRASQFIFPLLVGSVLLTFLLLAKDLKFSNLLPITLHTELGTVIRSEVSSLARNTELVLVSFLVPSMNQQTGARRAAIYATLFEGFLWSIMAISITGSYGLDLQHRLFFPFFSAAQMISVVDFLERVDAMVMSVWFFGMFIRSALILWGASQALQHLAGLVEYRPLVTGLAAFAVTYAVAQAESLPELRSYVEPQIFTPFMLLFVSLIPFLLLLIGTLRRMGQQPHATAAPQDPQS